MSSEAKRRAAVGVGVGLAASHAYTRIKFHQITSNGFRVEDPPAPGSPEFARLLEGLTGSPVRRGNRVRILRNGCRTFPAMLEAIGSAQETVDELARHFLEDLEVSVELDLERWRLRPLARRALEHAGEVARQSF